MTRHPFDPQMQDLPAELPVFPLPGVLLLPGGNLPLNIFEPRYLSMVRAALATPQRLIGMIQPQEAESWARRPELYPVGCAGRVAELGETDDGRYVISLRGICRFRLERELEPAAGGFRRIKPDWLPYAADLEMQEASACAAASCRAKLETALRSYFARNNITADWGSVRETSLHRLVTSLAMICPFDTAEKQALLEAEDGDARTHLMLSLLEMANHDLPPPEDPAAGPGRLH